MQLCPSCSKALHCGNLNAVQRAEQRRTSGCREPVIVGLLVVLLINPKEQKSWEVAPPPHHDSSLYSLNRGDKKIPECKTNRAREEVIL